ncbi:MULTISPECIES: glycosyltransferase family 4 protein [Peribacillus]|uniref:glycosyltransferase family 4 protein n=1 Tax=Peribacillus TaxID=2675229 RepID=UPI001F4E796F|nr:glycosyltransferase family 4 protein [Peribacillus sp. Aquil_B1]MCK2007125.1 glycosyltransferase family 4 protein [Peribacillus sp. Aquil_B8]
MKILYLHQYFNIDKGSTRSYEIAKFLVSKNNKVTIITGKSVDSREGIKIISTKTKYKQEYSYLKRLLSFVHYMYKSFFIGVKEKGVDVVYASSTPLTIGLIGMLLAKVKRSEFVFEVRDLWPDIPIELGIIRHGWLKRILLKLESMIYSSADKIIVLSPGMKEDLLRKGVKREKIATVTNFADINYFSLIRSEDKEEALDKLDLKAKFICLYAGTLGFINNIDYILQLAEKTDDPDIVYLIVGDGKEKERLIQVKESKKLNNVIFLDQVSKKEAYLLMAVSHIGLCFVRDHEILDRNSQNKLFDFWAAGKPTLINYKGWQHEVMTKYDAGHGFEYSERSKMIEYVKSMKSDNRMYLKIQENIERLTLNYEKTKLISKLERTLSELVDNDH